MRIPHGRASSDEPDSDESLLSAMSPTTIKRCADDIACASVLSRENGFAWTLLSTLRSVCGYSALANGDRAAHGNEKGPRWRAFLTVGDVPVELADAGGVTVVRAELSPILLVTDE